jgi:hypothetical protein
LSADDVAGICATYPPGRKAATKSCENRHGFSEQCGADQPAPQESKGCSLNTRTAGLGANGGNTSLFAFLAAALAVCVARRRRSPCTK